MHQLDDVADDAHDQEADADGLRDADELLLVGLWTTLVRREVAPAQRRTGGWVGVREMGGLEEGGWVGVYWVGVLVQRFMNRVPSLRNSAGILQIS